MFILKKVKSLLAVGAAAFSLFAFNPNALAFQEYPIGDEIEDTENHFKVALVYFQPVPMEPQGMMLSPDKADIHIETDIHATEGNECGFGVGEWIPYMRVEYKFRAPTTVRITARTSKCTARELTIANSNSMRPKVTLCTPTPIPAFPVVSGKSPSS